MVQFKNLPEELAAQLDGLEILALQDPNDSDIVKKLKLDELEKALEVLAKNVQDAAWSPENVVRVVQNLAEDLPGQVYADPQDAIDYIIAAGPPSENDPWVLEFGAGVFDVSGLTVTGVPRLTIRGQSKQINQTWTATPGTRLKVSSGYLFDEISSPVLVSNCHITLDGGTAVLGLSGNGAYFNECAFELGAAGQIYGDTGGANNLFFRCFFEGAAHLVQTHGDTFVDCDFNAANPSEGIRLQTGDAAGRRLFNLIGCRNLPNAATSRPFFDVSNLNDDCAINLIDCEVEPASGGASDYVNAPAGGTTTLTLRKTALGGAQINAAVSVSGQDLTGPFTPSAHASTHADGGSDEVKVEDLPTDDTNAGYVLTSNGDGTQGFAAPSGGGGPEVVLGNQDYAILFDDFYWLNPQTGNNYAGPWHTYQGNYGPHIGENFENGRGIILTGSTGYGDNTEFGQIYRLQSIEWESDRDVFFEIKVRAHTLGDGSAEKFMYGLFNPSSASNMGGETGAVVVKYEKATSPNWIIAVNGVNLVTSSVAVGGWVKIKVKYNSAGTPEWWLNDVQQTNPGVGSGVANPLLFGFSHYSDGSSGAEVAIDYVKVWTARY